MNVREFSMELDGQRVVVSPGSQEVQVLDAEGRTLLRERIQVAAGSVQGLFTQLTDTVDLIQPTRHA